MDQIATWYHKQLVPLQTRGIRAPPKRWLFGGIVCGLVAQEQNRNFKTAGNMFLRTAVLDGGGSVVLDTFLKGDRSSIITSAGEAITGDGTSWFKSVPRVDAISGTGHGWSSFKLVPRLEFVFGAAGPGLGTFT